MATNPVDETRLACFVRLGDPKFRLRVLFAEWIWEIAGIAQPTAGATSSAAQRQATDSALSLSGCRWIVADVDAQHARDYPQPSDRRLQDVLRPPRFQHVGTFALITPSPATVALYRQVGPIQDLSLLLEQAKTPATALKWQWLLRSPLKTNR